MTLLIISDSPFLMEQVEEGIATRMPFLKVIGKCYTLREGIRAVQALQPDIVLLDGDMESASIFLKTFVSKGIKLVVITSDEEKWRLRLKAMAQIMCKPFKVAAFHDLIHDQ